VKRWQNFEELDQTVDLVTDLIDKILLARSGCEKIFPDVACRGFLSFSFRRGFHTVCNTVRQVHSAIRSGACGTFPQIGGNFI
jgi:hypothetical protein